MMKAANSSFPPPGIQFYRRVLPATCIAFGSEEGKQLFQEALLSGYANIYFPLAEQFRTQSEPAYCGLSTLVMVLNALAVDPKRIWKGPWRWYHEEMLDCCLSLDVVQQEGITMEQFVCLAICNSLNVKAVRMSENESIDEFRQLLKEVCSGGGRILTCTYSRRVIGQTGSGHFSPIGAYNEVNDVVLIFDVARYKYPPHWVKVHLLWDAMKSVDEKTGFPRGYITMEKREVQPLLLFRLSNTFRATIALDNLPCSNMSKFLKSWKEFIKISDCTDVCEKLEDVVTYALESLNESLAALFEKESVFTTQFNTCCIDALPTEHADGVGKLLKSLENVEIYGIVKKWVTKFKLNNEPVSSASSMCDGCTQENCCWIARMGISITEALEDTQCSKPVDVNANCKKANDSKCVKSPPCENADKNLVTESHYITMFLLSWPYKQIMDKNVPCLVGYIDNSMKNCDGILLNEAEQLRQQIQSLILMVKSNGSSS